MTDFQLENFAQRGEKLLNETRKIFTEYKDLKLTEFPLPKNMQPSDGAVKLVFVGQYSAGKSSIIKMLSGIDTEIGAGIKTQEAQSYEWNGLEIIDTPGIHTELRPDHDEKTYYEIDHAALLIFVVTNEGFDDRMGNHFRKLAIEQDRGKNMVLVVNKMDRTALGNTPEQQEVIANDLKKVITPLTAENLYLSFLDTESYFEFLNETDQDMKDFFLEQSGREIFVENLNKFVASRGVLSKIQAPLETLKSAITNVIGESEQRDVDKDLNAVEEILKRKEKSITEGKRKIKVEIAELANTCAQKIKAEGESAAGIIAPGTSEDEINRGIKNAEAQAELYVSNYETEMISRLSDICEGINEELTLIDHSNFAANVRANINKKSMSLTTVQNNVGVHENDEERVGKFIKSMGGTQTMATLLNLTSKGAASITIPVIGTKASSIVKGVGHFFNFKFQPWGAVNVVKNVSNILGAVGLAFTAYQAYKKFSGEEEKKANEAVRKAQNEIRNGFDDYANSIEKEFVTVANDKMDELTAPVLKAAQDSLAEFKNKKERLTKMAHSLQNILEEVENLMEEVQQTARA